MKRISLFLLAAGIAHGAVTDVTVSYQRDGEIRIVKVNSSVFGAKLAVTATGAWTLAKGTCTSFAFWPTTGSGNATIYAMPSSLSTTSLTGGVNDTTGSCTGNVGGINFTLNWRIRRMDGMFTTDFSGRFDSAWDASCGASNALHGYKNSCTATAAYAPNDGVALPAVGDIITDPLYGGRGLRCGELSTQPYGGYSFNRDETMMVTANGIKDTSDCSVVAAASWPTGCTYSVMYWNYRSIGEQNGGWCISDATPFTVKAWHISGGSIVDDGVVFTHTDNLADHGSTGNPISADGHMVFPTDAREMCIIHIPTGASSLLCVDVGDPDITVRHVQIAPRKDSDGKHRAMHGSDALVPPSFEDHRTYALKDGVFAIEARIPNADRAWLFGDDWGHAVGYDCATTGSNGCFLRYGHSTTFSSHGTSGTFGNFITYQSGGGSNFLNGFGGCTWSNGPDGCYPKELGGGGLSRRVGHTNQYTVCAVGSMVCGSAHYGNDPRVRRLTATESGGVCTGTIASGTNTFSTNDRVLMNKFSVAGWNGYVTLTGSSGSTLTWACTGAGTSLTGYVVIAEEFATTVDGINPNLWHTGACRMDIGHCKIASKWQGTSGADPSGDAYSDAVLPKISFRGTYMAVNDSMGYPEQGGITIWDTGFVGCTEATRPNDFCGGGGLRVIPLSDTTARATVTTPYAGGACTLTWSTVLDYASATTQALTAGTTVREYTITGLTASTKYYLNAYCDGLHRGVAKTNWHYAIDEMTTLSAAPGGSVAYSFLLPPAPTGTVTYRVEYGTTSGLGTQFDDGCTAGEKCHTTISLARGVAYYRYKWLNGSSAVIRETPIVSRVLR